MVFKLKSARTERSRREAIQDSGRGPAHAGSRGWRGKERPIAFAGEAGRGGAGGLRSDRVRN